MRHINIPIFIPHLGCPNACVFCNQKKISGSVGYDFEDVESEIERALSTTSSEDEIELAFFGGSFTGIDRGEMLRLLALAKGYMLSGRIGGIRLSTRPDYIDPEITAILREYGVMTVELGIQSMSDAVLRASGRGHSAADSEKACAMLVDAGISVVGQMMIGLPASTASDEVETAERICRMGCSASRIYPTAVFAGTELEAMVHRREYIPLTLEDAVERSAAALEVFLSHGVKCIRIGLCEGKQLHDEDGIVAGISHSAVGELAMSCVMRNRIFTALDLYESKALIGKTLVITVGQGMTSRTAGQKRCNKDAIRNKYHVNNIKIVENTDVLGYNIKIDVF
ncbi:MAG: radical SAM protein [Clostridia bacterium]|nr:radical SAM protein [Clostridia bacterium]